MAELLSLLYHDVWRLRPRESGFADAGAAQYKLEEAVFDAHLERLSSIVQAPPTLLRRPASLPASDSVGETGMAPWALTFDDGGVSYHSIIADRLEQYDWRGHCFVTSGQIGQRGFLSKHHLRELHERGHVIGTHSVTHPLRIDRCSRPVLLSEWQSSRACLEDIIGAEVRVGSVPGGHFSARVLDAAREAGLTVLFTSAPELRVKNVGGCLIAGRFAIREGCTVARLESIVRRERALRMREWASWNGKKVLKSAFGPGYRRLSAKAAEGGYCPGQ